LAGRRTVRDAELSGGNRMTREANAGVLKGDGKAWRDGLTSGPCDV